MHIDLHALWTEYGALIIAAGQNLLGAILTLFIGLWLANNFANTVRRVSRKHPRVDDTLANFFARIVRYVLVAIVILAVLSRFGVQTTSIIALISAAALAVGLALQGTLSNLAAGVMLILFRPYKLGDQVKLGDAIGKVRDITLFTTEIVTPDNIRIVLPNGLIWGAAMINYSANATRRIDLDFAIAYDANIDEAIEALLGVAKANRMVLSDPAPKVDIRRIADVSVILWMRAWASTPDFFDTQQALLHEGKQALDAKDIPAARALAPPPVAEP